MNKQGCPDNFEGQNFQLLPPPQPKGIRFLFLSWFDPPLVWATEQMFLSLPRLWTSLWTSLSGTRYRRLREDNERQLNT